METEKCKHNPFEVVIKDNGWLGETRTKYFIMFCTSCKRIQYPPYTERGSILPAPQWMTIDEYRLTLTPKIILETLSGIEIPT